MNEYHKMWGSDLRGFGLKGFGLARVYCNHILQTAGLANLYIHTYTHCMCEHSVFRSTPIHKSIVEIMGVEIVPLIS